MKQDAYKAICQNSTEENKRKNTIMEKKANKAVGGRCLRGSE